MITAHVSEGADLLARARYNRIAAVILIVALVLLYAIRLLLLRKRQ